MNRRKFVQAGAGALAAAPWMACSRGRSGIRVESVSSTYEDYMYRTPIKFGGAIVDRVTLLNVDCVVRAPDGRTAKGFGSMPLGNVWSFPSQVLKYDQTLAAMKGLADKIAAVMNGYKEYGHPIDINVSVEPAFFKAAAEVQTEQQLAEAIPPLCTLVTASPFDAAVHDAFGKIHHRSTYQTYGPDLLPNDLSRYLGPEYEGLRLDSFISPQPKPTMPLYHLVGAVDPLTDADNKNPIKDGLPETLPQWIEYNGLTHIKIKLNGDDLAWDVNRVLSVDRIAAQTQAKRKVAQWYYSLDFNEKCRNVGYLLEFIQKVKAGSPAAFARIQYIEQPTARDLRAHRENVMHEVSKIVPVVIDESLIDLESLMLAREMGYTGAALKACKGQSHAVLMAAAAQYHKMFLCVQDLTCPGASLIHSAGLAAHVPAVAGIEANARQYVPAANKGWDERFPGIFVFKNGQVRTGVLTGPGLSAVQG